MSYKKYSGNSGTEAVRDWKEEVLDDVATGMFQAMGLLPTRSVSKLAMYSGDQTAGAVPIPDGNYVRLGRQLVTTLRGVYAGGYKGPSGAALVNPAEFGYQIVGTKQGMLDAIGNAVMETAETMTGGLVSNDDGGLDAAALGGLVQLGKAFADVGGDV